MEKVNIGISDADRESVAFLLNQVLADEHILYIKTRNYHWNVRGMHFMSLHVFFEQQYKLLEEMIDEVAERIRMIGHFAIGSMKDYISLGRLLETSPSNGDGESMLRSLLHDHEDLIHILRKDLEKEASEFKDMGTSDFITNLMERHEKMAWMIRSFLG